SIIEYSGAVETAQPRSFSFRNIGDSRRNILVRNEGSWSERTRAGTERTGAAALPGRNAVAAGRPVHRAAIFAGDDDWRRRCAGRGRATLRCAGQGPRRVSGDAGAR